MKHLHDIENLAVEKPKVLSGYVVALLLGMVGAALCAYGGYVYQTGFWFYEYGQGAGPVAIIAGLGGFVIFFGIGLCVAGPGEQLYQSLLAAMPLGSDRWQLTGLATFHLYITVHRIKNLYNTDPCEGLARGLASPYVEVVVGRSMEDSRQLSIQKNPPKRTCVSASNNFEECFHFVVSPTDDTIRFTIYDQDLMTDNLVGTCDVDINDQVLAAGFPQKKSFRLTRGEALDPSKSVDRDADHHAGSVIVSFAPGENFPMSALPAVSKKDEFAVQRMQRVTGQLHSEAVRLSGKYGAMVTGMASGK